MDLQGPLTSGFLILEKQSESHAIGHFLNEPLHFMPLISGYIKDRTIPTINTLPVQPESICLLNNHFYPASLENRTFLWFLQWMLPGCRLIRQTLRKKDGTSVKSIQIVDTEHQTITRFREEQEQWNASTFGETKLWEQLQSIAKVFTDMGRPEPQDYAIDIKGKSIALSCKSLRLHIS